MAKVIRRSVGSFQHECLSPLIARVYGSRGVKSISDVDYQIKHLLPFHGLKSIDLAAVCLADAISAQKNILIIGDFDVDGATSTSLVTHALRAMGAKHVDYLLPDRFKFGYGLTPGIVKESLRFSPDLIITVDNGISSIDGVAAARAAGIEVLVTDHHLPGEQLPLECIIVNPSQPDDTFASKSLAGVGVIFYVMCALRAELRKRSWFLSQGISEVNMADYLDLVALGTVADVVPLDYNNRLLVSLGIARMRQGFCRPGITALVEVGRRTLGRLCPDDLGFAVGPRINAAGRLDDMTIGVQCLLSESRSEAMSYAVVLNDLNQSRREIEATMKTQALDLLNTMSIPAHSDHAVCLYDPTWHEGVVGLIASRIKDQVHRPTIAFAPHGNSILKGSGRSIPGLHLRDVLADVNAANPGLIDRFGGHAMAVGLSLHPNHLPLFTKEFKRAVLSRLDDVDLEQCLYTDGELEPNELSVQVTREIDKAGPFGQQFPPPMFDGVFEVVNQCLVGEKHLKLFVRQPGQIRTIEAIKFFIDLDAWPNYSVSYVHLVYRLDINHYQGNERLQLVIEQVTESCAPYDLANPDQIEVEVA